MRDWILASRIERRSGAEAANGVPAGTPERARRSPSTRWVTLGVVAALLLFAAPAAAEQKGVAYARGLVEFNAGRYQSALPFFERAVAADPNDAYARYYAAVTRARLGDKPGAESDLRAALALRPDLAEAALELGMLLVDTGRYAEAVPLLENASRATARAAEASLFLGLAQLRLGRTREARASFERAAADPSLAVAARYYLGVIAFQEGRNREAAQAFRAVREASPATEMGREAAKFLDALDTGAPFYRLYGGVGLEYDSNVALQPSGDVIQNPFPTEDDGRFTIWAGGRLSPVRSDAVRLTLGYEFFQSLHFDLTEFNLQDHRPNLALSFLSGPVRFGIDARYDFYLRETDAFLHEVVAAPWVTVLEEGFGSTTVFFRERYRNFLQDEFDIRDALNHSPGIRQLVELGAPERYLTLGYRYDHEDPFDRDLATRTEAAKSFAYDGHEVSTGFGWLWPQVVDGHVSYAYRREDYDKESNGRDDDEHNVVVAVSRALTDFLRLTCAYLGTINDSNKSVFEYDRHIGSISLEVSF